VRQAAKDSSVAADETKKERLDIFPFMFLSNLLYDSTKDRTGGDGLGSSC
jgi:hypothetical protein